ncbi:unnamed protein product [Acanthoscelides obtectus]|uniref:Methionine--tRNA ligase, cytoplasmic n=1 Tax=Acanthoscelides obtectus TaxID=200917 RepID=A0A9P0MM39_ACAOB|nr:unnamed protein product [Acanthoscelides obtectus]CAK1639175.1 Methionine--tRNA ligase, cytoplasmic [Acanthoscelides obtectus]
MPSNRSIPQPRRLPCVEEEENLTLFLPNSAVCYFNPVKENTSEVLDWLEWEAKNLSPCLAYLCGSSVKNPSFKKTLQTYLTKLECSLKDKVYLIGNTFSNADIVIWSTLYPLYLNEALRKEYLLLPNIIKWIEHCETIPQFKEAVAFFKIDGKTAYAALAAGAKYLPIPDLTSSEGTSEESGSPQHTVEVVSEEELKSAKAAWSKDVTKLPKLKQRNGKVLPVSKEKNIFITSALPYVNNVPHLGNIIGCVLSADVFARFCRLCNYNTLYLCGTDEYGTATETKALEEKLTCREICDKYFKIHNEIYQWFNISFDHFGRTSNPEQSELCQEMFLRLNENGFMFTQSVEQLHCPKCDRYLADRFVEGGCPHLGCNYEDARGDQCDGCGKLVNAVELKNPRCKVCGSRPKLKTSNQFFIDLPKLEPLLHHWMKLSTPGWSNNAQVISKSWLKEGLKPRCITRDLKWGVPVPLDDYRNKVFYVWFDAPIGYMSICKAYTKDFEKWWRPSKDVEVKLYQFMAKDNVPFHGVLFPAMLLGANRGYTTVSHLMATEYLNYEDGKFSKSRGVGVFGNDAQSTGIPSDVWRFYLLYIRPESQDSSFSWNDLVTKNNSELLNNLGNFVNRALMFAKNSFNGVIPQMAPSDADYRVLALCTREYAAYVTALEKCRLRDGIRHILAISRHGNQYMQANQPWVLAKGTEEEKLRAGTVVGICCNLACLLAVLLQPYMPETSATLKKQINAPEVVITPSNPEIVQLLPPGHKLGNPSPLFSKIDSARVEELKKKFAGKQNDRNNGSGDNTDVKAVEEMVAKQADKVRLLKSSGADKKVWQPEVATLLDLKKKLEAAQKAATSKPEQKHVQNGIVDVKEIDKMTEEVNKQGLVVRKLKEGGAEKSVWQPEVEKLLALKAQLAVASGTPAAASGKGKKTKK